MDLSRNKIFSEGLRQNGVQVLTCVDRTPGVKKYWNLYQKYKGYKGRYDVLIVGYGGYVTVPLAKFLSNKPVLFDALCSFYETEILSRDALKEIPFRKFYVRFVDWLSTRFADKVLVESEVQKEFFTKELRVKREKLVAVYTGVDDTVFKKDEGIQKYDTFTVLFRGRIMSEAGVPTIVRAAKLLEKEGIDFLIIGYGCNESMREFEETLKREAPENVRYVGEHMPLETLVAEMQRCHVSLGQFAKHERLKRTIPHKAFESLALGLPYITARASGIQEILEEGKHCLMVNPEDPEDLAKAIFTLYNTPSICDTLLQNGLVLVQKKFLPRTVVYPLCEILNNF